MKKILYLFLLLGFISNCKAQSDSENKFIKKIKKQSLNRNIEKLEFSKDLGSRGDYTKTILYLKKNKPILVEIEKKEIIHQYLLDDTEQDMITVFYAKFYILNWKNNKYIRIGKIIENNNLENLEYNMLDYYVLEYNREDIENEIMKKSK